MLQKQNRFHGRRSVVAVLKKGSATRAGDFSIRSVSANATPRLAVVVSKKVDKRAVVRNRIRRRIMAALGQQMKSETMHKSVVVIVHSQKIMETDFKLLQQQLLDAIA